MPKATESHRELRQESKIRSAMSEMSQESGTLTDDDPESTDDGPRRTTTPSLLNRIAYFWSRRVTHQEVELDKDYLGIEDDNDNNIYHSITNRRPKQPAI